MAIQKRADGSFRGKCNLCGWTSNLYDRQATASKAYQEHLQSRKHRESIKPVKGVNYNGVYVEGKKK